jgi:hypothetical protein
MWAGQVGGEFSAREKETQSCEPIGKKRPMAVNGLFSIKMSRVMNTLAIRLQSLCPQSKFQACCRMPIAAGEKVSKYGLELENIHTNGAPTVTDFQTTCYEHPQGYKTLAEPNYGVAIQTVHGRGEPG